MTRYLPYLLAGILFGFTMVKAEAASWYRIQEMFHFQSFHMFGILFSAIVTAMISIQIIKRVEGKKSITARISRSLPRNPAGSTTWPAALSSVSAGASLDYVPAPSSPWSAPVPVGPWWCCWGHCMAHGSTVPSRASCHTEFLNP